MLVYIVERLRRAQFSQLTGQCHEKRSTEAPGALTRLHLWEYALQCTYVSFIPFSSIKKNFFTNPVPLFFDNRTYSAICTCSLTKSVPERICCDAEPVLFGRSRCESPAPAPS